MLWLKLSTPAKNQSPIVLGIVQTSVTLRATENLVSGRMQLENRQREDESEDKYQNEQSLAEK